MVSDLREHVEHVPSTYCRGFVGREGLIPSDPGRGQGTYPPMIARAPGARAGLASPLACPVPGATTHAAAQQTGQQQEHYPQISIGATAGIASWYLYGLESLGVPEISSG